MAQIKTPVYYKLTSYYISIVESSKRSFIIDNACGLAEIKKYFAVDF